MVLIFPLTLCHSGQLGRCQLSHLPIERSQLAHLTHLAVAVADHMLHLAAASFDQEVALRSFLAIDDSKSFRSLDECWRGVYPLAAS